VTGYLLIRELLMLAVVCAFGAGFAALISPQDRFTSRLALAPSAGVALASGILLTVNLFVPLRHSFWFVVVPVALLSAFLVRRSGLRIPPLRELIAVGAVLAVALGAGSYALVERNSPGPVGYGIFDAPGYVTYAQGYEAYTNREPLLDAMGGPNARWLDQQYDDVAWGKPYNLSQRYGFGFRWQHSASNTINATAAGAAGWAPWTLATSLIIMLLAVGALGSYALAGYLGAGLIARTLAGFVYVGPLIYTVAMDGSEGLVAGLAAAPAVMVLTAIAFERPTKRTAAMAGAVIGGIQAIYPELAPALIGGLILAALVRFGLPVVRRRAPWRSVLPVLRTLPIAIGVALLVGLRAVPWTWQYFVGADYAAFAGTLVHYNMGIQYIPGWLYQTREFYQFAFARPSGSEQALIGVALPVLMMIVSAAALVLSRRARWLAGIFLAVVLQALWSQNALGNDCTYCVQRSLLILGPLLPALMLTGASLLMARGGRTRDTVLVLGALATVAVGSTTIAVQKRMREGLVVTPRALQATTEAAGRIGKPTLLEGFGTTPFASWVYGPTGYGALTQTVDRLSVVTPYNDWGGMAYIRTRPKGDPAWTPDYETVLTRLGGVGFPGRKTVFQAQPYSVQERAHPFDVTPASGLGTDLPEHDPLGAAYVQNEGEQLGFPHGKLRFWIAADDDRPAYFRFRLQSATIPNLGVTAPEGVGRLNVSRPSPDAVDVCARVTERSATREVAFRVVPPPGPVTAPLRKYEQAAQPSHDIRLLSLAATTKPCD
jgi:hypothetical protein